MQGSINLKQDYDTAADPYRARFAPDVFGMFCKQATATVTSPEYGTSPELSGPNL